MLLQMHDVLDSNGWQIDGAEKSCLIIKRRAVIPAQELIAKAHLGTVNSCGKLMITGDCP
jgi:hypothetical protein